jgi:hypothetical protein
MEATDEASRIPFEVMIMEPAVYGTEFQQIVPAGHWKRLDSWHHNNQIMELSIPLDPIPSVQSLSKQWRFNTNSERMTTIIAAAHKEAVAWAKKNIKKPVTIEGANMVQFGLVEGDGLKVEIDFPMQEGEMGEIGEVGEMGEIGEVGSYVTGVYDIDEGTFTKMKVRKVEE